MKKVLLVVGLMMFLVGCKNGKNSFDEQAIKEIENSKYVEAMCKDLGVQDVEIEILDKEVKKDSAEVECEVTYKNDYVIGKETLICEMEKEDGKWEIDDIDSEEELECEPLKFPVPNAAFPSSHPFLSSLQNNLLLAIYYSYTPQIQSVPKFLYAKK